MARDVGGVGAEVIAVERLPVLRHAGFDCPSGNCPSCAAGSKGNHGISGGRVWFVVAANAGGTRYALSLDVSDIRYPDSCELAVRRAAKMMPRDPYNPRRANALSLCIHERASIASLANDDQCDWVDGPCNGQVVSFIEATELFTKHGNRDEDVGVQPEALWLALEARLRELVECQLAERDGMSAS